MRSISNSSPMRNIGETRDGAGRILYQSTESYYSEGAKIRDKIKSSFHKILQNNQHQREVLLRITMYSTIAFISMVTRYDFSHRFYPLQVNFVLLFRTVFLVPPHTLPLKIRTIRNTDTCSGANGVCYNEV